MESNWDRSLSYVEEEFGSPWYMLHRVDMHDELKRLAFGDGPGQPAELRLGSRVVEVVGVELLALRNIGC
jgi:hypothetical protein